MKSPGERSVARSAALQGVIQQQIQYPLAVEILKREFTEGSRVKIDYVDGEFTFERVE